MSRLTTRNALLALAGAAAIVAGAGLLALPGSEEWTTSSPEAMAEFAAAMEASQKLYYQEARSHLEKALELDPDFVVAKVKMAESCRYDDAERSNALLEQALQTDLGRLTARERFIVERAALLEDLKFDEANKHLDAYIQEHPNDPYVLHIKALQAWQKGELETAERLNKRLLEISPNWVLAYNQLGYITMMQGRFAEAEEYFTSYRFIAPDQANPHDSLGELFILLGRFGEAEESLLEALDNKPDFMAAFEHLSLLEALRQDWDAANEWLQRGVEAGAIDDEYRTSQECALRFWRLAEDRDWSQILELAEGPCQPEDRKNIQAAVYLHNAACHLGKAELALSLESAIEKEIEQAGPGQSSKVFEVLAPMLHHMRGIRLAIVEKDLEAATNALQTADEYLTYINSGVGLFKLSNRLVLAAVLRDRGLEGRAHDLISEVRVVNPEVVEHWEHTWAPESNR